MHGSLEVWDQATYREQDGCDGPERTRSVLATGELRRFRPAGLRTSGGSSPLIGAANVAGVSLCIPLTLSPGSIPRQGGRRGESPDELYHPSEPPLIMSKTARSSETGFVNTLAHFVRKRAPNHPADCHSGRRSAQKLRGRRPLARPPGSLADPSRAASVGRPLLGATNKGAAAGKGRRHSD